MALEEVNRRAEERHREVMRRLNQACLGAWIAAVVAQGLLPTGWALLRYVFSSRAACDGRKNRPPTVGDPDSTWHTDS